jgi:hypothetical protein
MVKESETGYDVEEIIRRRGGRPSLGTSPSTVESVRLDSELKRDLILRASEQGISVSDAIRRGPETVRSNYVGAAVLTELRRAPLVMIVV